MLITKVNVAYNKDLDPSKLNFGSGALDMRNDVSITVTLGVVAKVDYSTAANPLALPRCAETRPPPARRHGSGIIGKISPPIQVEPAPPVFALHPDAVENNEESENRT